MKTMTKFILVCLSAIALIWLLSFLVLPAEAAQDDVMLKTFNAICKVESSNNPNAHNKKEDARGAAQIRLIMVKDVNRIVGSTRYDHDDAWSRVKSYEMFKHYQKRYSNTNSPEQMARNWNGGPNGYKKSSTKTYWSKVQKEINKR